MELSDPQSAEAKQVRELRARDAEVRQHEMAHVAAGGPYVISGPHYEFQTGPDGKQYAIGGHVKIDTAPVAGDPEATIRKMQTVRAAAMAPAEPSGADHAVAAKAMAELMKAHAEKSKAPEEDTAAAERGPGPEVGSGSATAIGPRPASAEEQAKGGLLDVTG